jgi:capsular polysaccharide transport system permease protein
MLNYKLFKKFNFLQILFIFLFLIAIIYINFFKSKLYESDTTFIIKNLNNKTATFDNFSFIVPNTSATQDIFVIEAYLKSFDELQKLNKKFNLKKHYSKDIDIVERLKPWSTKEDFLNLYLKRLVFIYDQSTGITTLGFLHTDPKLAYKIVRELIVDTNNQLNKFYKLIAQKELKYLKKEVEKNKKALDESVKKLIAFQNKHIILDPTQTATAKFSLLSSLQTELIKKTAKLKNLFQYMNNKNFEIIRLKGEINNLKNTINKIKKSLTNPNKKSLNIYIFEFERLKNLAELNKELYKQSLIQYQQLKNEINKNSKTLLQITQPFIPQGYKYPEKIKDTITIALILLLLYGIISLIQAIIKEHID